MYIEESTWDKSSHQGIEKFEKLLNKGGYDKLLRQQTESVDNQGILILMNVDSEFFDIELNYH